MFSSPLPPSKPIPYAQINAMMAGIYSHHCFDLHTNIIIYGAAVAITVASAEATATTQVAAPYPLPIAVVAQRRAPAIGDMGARPIFGIFCHWCTMTPGQSSNIGITFTICNHILIMYDKHHHDNSSLIMITVYHHYHGS